MYEAAIGLEVHLHLKTRTKAFCGCEADYFGAPPNTHTCPGCLGLPGSLPVPNKKAVEFGLKLALALGSRVPERLVFHRKNYFYPSPAPRFRDPALPRLREGVLWPPGW